MRVHHKWLYAYVDMLLAYNFVLTAAVFFLMLNVNPIAKDQEALSPPGTIAVQACWPEGPTDVDLWVFGPKDDKPVGYSRKSGPVWSLLFDDMGIVNDDGPTNCEDAFARSTPAGEYIINVHGYSIPGPLTVSVKISLNGSLLDKTSLEIRPKQERTVIRFKLDGRGKLIPDSENRVFKAIRSAAQ
jgi:hypothetical protein